MRPISELPQDKYLTPKGVAAFLGCSPRNVRKLYSLGRLRGWKAGHRTLWIERESVVEYLEKLSES